MMHKSQFWKYDWFCGPGSQLHSRSQINKMVKKQNKQIFQPIQIGLDRLFKHNKPFDITN